MLADGHPGGRHRLRDRRAGQGRRERVPGHQDLVHQRDGRGLRGDRRRRDAAGRGALATTRGSAAASCTPASASAAAACPRTSARSWPGPASSASTRRCRFLTRGRRDQPAAAGPDGRPGPRAARRLVRRRAGSPCSARRSSPTATTSATRRRSTSPRRLQRAGADGHASTTRRRWTTPGETYPHLALRRDRRRGGPATPTSCCT